MILISGANGSIGSCLVRYLTPEYQVRAMTHYNSENIPKGVEVVKADLRFRDDVDDAVRGCDTIIHLAAQIHVDVSRAYPELFYETNVRGTMNVLEAARRHDAFVIHMSSCEVLGHIQEGRADESWPYRWPMSPYAASKLAAEQYCLSWYHTYGLNVSIARGFNLVGPYQRPGSKGALIPKITQMVLRGEAPTIYGGGGQIRDYIDVRDLCMGLEALLHGDHRGELFHFCSGVGVTVNQVIALILKVTDSDLKPIHVEGRPGELLRSVGYAGKALRVLGWRPRISLGQSIRDVAEAQRG
jgi:UDP-glucose 4-epimerase